VCSGYVSEPPAFGGRRGGGRDPRTGRYGQVSKTVRGMGRAASQQRGAGCASHRMVSQLDMRLPMSWP